MWIRFRGNAKTTSSRHEKYNKNVSWYLNNLRVRYSSWKLIFDVKLDLFLLSLDCFIHNTNLNSNLPISNIKINAKHAIIMFTLFVKHIESWIMEKWLQNYEYKNHKISIIVHHFLFHPLSIALVDLVRVVTPPILESYSPALFPPEVMVMLIVQSYQSFIMHRNGINTLSSINIHALPIGARIIAVFKSLA